MPGINGGRSSHNKGKDVPGEGKPRNAGVLLAAGASTRMGTLKQLLPLPGTVLLAAVLEETLRSNLDTVVLVLGHRSREIRRTLGEKLAHPKLQIVENPGYEKGISSSIRCGLQQVESDHDNVMVLLADMPYVNARLINLLLEQYVASQRPLGAICIKGRRFHPVIFSSRLYGELHTLQGDVGARGLFETYGDQVCLVEPEEPYDPRDIDTPEDYAALKGDEE